MKKIITILLTLVMVISMSACNQKQEETKGYTFGFTSMDNSNPFFTSILAAVQEKVEANGDKLIIVDAAQDQQKQNDGISQMIEEGIDGLFLNPFVSDEVDSALDALNAAGVPIVNFDTAVDSIEKVNTFVGTDNYAAGKLCGEDLVSRMPEGGKIVIIDFATADSANNRINGFLDAIDQKGFEVVGRADAHGDKNTAIEVTTKLLQENADAKVVFAGNDPMAIGANAAAEELGIKDVMIYGVDGSPEYIEALSKNETLMAGTAAQSPAKIAEKIVEVMYELLNGNSVQDTYLIETSLVILENVSEYDTSEWK